MAKENVGDKSGCESPSHGQHLCYIVSQGFHISDPKEYQALVKEPEFKCRHCGRVAKNKYQKAKCKDQNCRQATARLPCQGGTSLFLIFDF